MDFEVAGRNVSFEDVNEKEHRLAELSRFVDQIRLHQHFDLVAAPLLMQQLPVLARWVSESQKQLSRSLILLQVAAYLAVGGTLDGDQLLSTSAWQVQLPTEIDL